MIKVPIGQTGKIATIYTTTEIDKIISVSGGIPPGGTTGQALVKIDSTDNNTQWASITKATIGLNNVVNTDTTTTTNITDSVNKRFVTDAEKTVINNTSGTNTGDQDISGLVTKTTTVNGHALSANVTISKSDVGLGNVDNTSDLNKPISTAQQTALDLKQDKSYSPPSCRVYSNADQSISNASGAAIAFNLERWDTDLCHDNSINNTRLTCKTPGKYLVIGNVTFADSASGLRGASIVKNTSEYHGYSMNSASSNRVSVSSIIDLAVNDWVELYAYQTSGTSLNVLKSNLGSANVTELSWIKVG